MKTQMQQEMTMKNESGEYVPNYKTLIGVNEESESYIEEMKYREVSFAWKNIIIFRQSCGHYEVFQSPDKEFCLEPDRKCTCCICSTNK